MPHDPKPYDLKHARLSLALSTPRINLEDLPAFNGPKPLIVKATLFHTPSETLLPQLDSVLEAKMRYANSRTNADRADNPRSSIFFKKIEGHEVPCCSWPIIDIKSKSIYWFVKGRRKGLLQGLEMVEHLGPKEEGVDVKSWSVNYVPILELEPDWYHWYASAPIKGKVVLMRPLPLSNRIPSDLVGYLEVNAPTNPPYHKENAVPAIVPLNQWTPGTLSEKTPKRSNKPAIARDRWRRFYDVLEEERAKRGWSAQRLAQEIGRPATSIYSAQNRYSPPTGELLADILNRFDAIPDDAHPLLLALRKSKDHE